MVLKTNIQLKPETFLTGLMDKQLGEKSWNFVFALLQSDYYTHKTKNTQHSPQWMMVDKDEGTCTDS